VASYGVNADLSPAERDSLDGENFAVLMTGEALLSRVGPDMRAVAIQLSGDTLHVRFWVSTDSDEMTETTDDVVADVEAFYSHVADRPRIDPEVVLGVPEPPRYREPWRMVFLAKPL
jgi:hypothetical protein